jgi:hypothetical protein
MKKAVIRLSYLPANETDDSVTAQPCIVMTFDNKQVRVVPIAPNVLNDCTGCIGSGDGGGVDCGRIPDCNKAIYVRATPANKLKHIAWLLDQH